jgi:hypothetical protein
LNVQNGDDASLTQQQLIKICLDLNDKTPRKDKQIIIPTLFGEYSLN